MTLDLKKIYGLLPAVYRSRDVAQQGPLQALVTVITEQLQVLEESLEQAYDDQFIETCQEWVVPYIADLVGERGLHTFPNASFSLRGQVANALSNRRRKGTVSVLEGLARDVTGWDTNVVEFFQLLATTQYMKHVRPGNLSIVPVRGAQARLLNTPFDTDAHTADVRNIESLEGKYNIPNIGLFLWRLQSYPLTQVPAFQLDARRFFFDAIGRNTALYTNPATRSDPTARVTALDVPMPISRRMLDSDLTAPRADPGSDPYTSYYGPDASIFLTYSPVPSPPASVPVISCDLSDVTDVGGNVIGWAHQPRDSIAIDPQLGRIAFPENQPPPAQVHTSYHYGFSKAIGGGQYQRTIDESQDVLIQVPQDAPSIQLALTQAIAQLTGDKTSAAVEITNNEYYLETPAASIPQNKHIELRAANGTRPVLVLSSDFTIFGAQSASFSIDGLLIVGGSVTVPARDTGGSPNELDELALKHCTLYPGPTPQIGTTAAQPAGPRLWIEATAVSVSLTNCICGSLRTDEGCEISIAESIVDALGPAEVACAALDSLGPAGQLTIQNSTIIGKVHARLMVLVSNTIFLSGLMPFDLWRGPVLADQLQQGCVRFSYVPIGSNVPRRYQCRPADGDPPGLSPQFTSLRCGDAGYCQLAAQSGAAITQGADDQSEMGVFHDLFQPQREANLRNSLQEFLRFALQAGIFHAS